MIDLNRIEEAAGRHAGDLEWAGADIAYQTHVTPQVVVEMVAMIRRQESELAKSHDEIEALKAARHPLADSFVAPGVKVDSEEFNSLAMDYRGAPITVEGNWPQVAYEKLVACADQHTARAVAAAVESIDLNSIEQYRVQMAAICTAALGYWDANDPIKPEFDTPALRDVTKLYAKYMVASLTPQPVAGELPPLPAYGWVLPGNYTDSFEKGAENPWMASAGAFPVFRAAHPAPSSDAGLKYQVREIGEGNWRDASKNEYERCQRDPGMDTRIAPCPYCGKSDGSHDRAYPHPTLKIPLSDVAREAGEAVRNAVHSIIGAGFQLRLADMDFAKLIRAAFADHSSNTAREGDHFEVDKMLEKNLHAQLDELGEEVARLQRALCFWLPSVTDREDEVALRILEDAFLLVGIDGNIPDDFKSAQELGWVTLDGTQALNAPYGDAVENLLKIMDCIRVFGDFYSKTQAGQALKEYHAALAAAHPANGAQAGLSDAARDVLAERRRQIEKEGFVPADDDAYVFGELRSAALCYISGDTKSGWPWDKEWWKPTDDRSDLIKAGALVIAEIERLDRAAPQKKEG